MAINFWANSAGNNQSPHCISPRWMSQDLFDLIVGGMTNVTKLHHNAFLNMYIYEPPNDTNCVHHQNNLLNPTMHQFHIPGCTICNRNMYMCSHVWNKMVHYGIYVWCIMGFVRWVDVNKKYIQLFAIEADQSRYIPLKSNKMTFIKSQPYSSMTNSLTKSKSLLTQWRAKNNNTSMHDITFIESFSYNKWK